MFVAVPAIIVKVAKKILSILLGDKKGRKTLGYIIGIAVFIVLLPMLAVYGLFGWMAGGGATELINTPLIYENIPIEQRQILEQNESELETIEVIFNEYGISQQEILKAKFLYISCLTELKNEDGFYDRYAECFLSQSEYNSIFDNLSSAFGIVFTDEEISQFEKLYGG